MEQRRAGSAEGYESDLLATTLNQLGVLHIAPGRPRRRGAPRTARELFERLFRSPDPRVHQAAVLLILTHPELASDARAAIDHLDGPLRDRAMRRYVAAAALQRMARSRIEQRLGPRPLILAAYLDDFGLPSLDEEFGRVALLKLSADEEARYGYNAWGTYCVLLDHFLAGLGRRGWGVVREDAPIRPA